MSNLLHKISHWLGWNGGNPESHYEGEKLIMCFKCYGCGDLSGCHDVTWLIDELTSHNQAEYENKS